MRSCSLLWGLCFAIGGPFRKRNECSGERLRSTATPGRGIFSWDKHCLDRIAWTRQRKARMKFCYGGRGEKWLHSCLALYTVRGKKTSWDIKHRQLYWPCIPAVQRTEKP